MAPAFFVFEFLYWVYFLRRSAKGVSVSRVRSVVGSGIAVIIMSLPSPPRYENCRSRLWYCPMMSPSFMFVKLADVVPAISKSVKVSSRLSVVILSVSMLSVPVMYEPSSCVIVMSAFCVSVSDRLNVVLLSLIIEPVVKVA